MAREVHEWIFDVGRSSDGLRLDSFLRQRLTWRSRARLRAAIEDGAVTVDAGEGQPAPGRVRAGLRLRSGQRVTVRLPAPQAEVPGGERGSEVVDVPILLEDEYLVAVSKPPDVNVYPTRRHRAGSLIELVHARPRAAEEDPPSPCHRLDRETSGVLLFAKGRRSRAIVQEQFERREVRKEYLAIVDGSPAEDEGTIDLPIGPDGASPVDIKMGVGGDGRRSPARTRWRVLERFARRVLLWLQPETGRQHQLRVHTAAIGCPILGDKLYLGGDDLFLRSLDGPLEPGDLERVGFHRLALHAWRLRIAHPASGRESVVEAPLWGDLESLLLRLREAEASHRP